MIINQIRIKKWGEEVGRRIIYSVGALIGTVEYC